MSTTTTSAGLIRRTVAQQVLTLTIDHPPANLLTFELLEQLDAAVGAASDDPAVHAIVLTAAGRFFVAGADIRIIAAIPSSREGAAIALRGQAVLNKIEAGPKPVIAAINGVCLGGGLELALACHIRLAADTARLGLPEINLGIMPGFGGTQRLPRLIGPRAIDMILTGDPISAAEAKTLGLVSQVHAPEDLLRQAQGLARKLAAKSQVALRAALRAIRDGAALELAAGLVREAQHFGTLCDTQDKREGVAAFLEKRQPHFTHR